MKIIRQIGALRRREALGQRPPGYTAACLRLGRVHDGRIEFTPWQFLRLRVKYFHCRRRRGLGDWLEFWLHPVVLLLDKYFATTFVGCARCAARKRKLNLFGHRLSAWLKYRGNHIATLLKL